MVKRIETGLDDIPRTVRLPPAEHYAMVSLMELDELARGTSPFKEVAIFALTVFVSCFPGAVPALRAAWRGVPVAADSAISGFFACGALIVGLSMAAVWAYQHKRQRRLLRAIMARKPSRLQTRVELDYRGR